MWLLSKSTMIHFFGSQDTKIYAVQAKAELSEETTNKLIWLFGNQPKIEASAIDAFFIGTRATMITPWSTNAVEITQNMGIEGIIRIEEFIAGKAEFDPMLSQEYNKLDQAIYTIDIEPEDIKYLRKSLRNLAQNIYFLRNSRPLQKMHSVP